MKKTLYELTTEEFVRVLFQVEKRYEIKVTSYSLDENPENDTVIGTYSQLVDVFTTLSLKDEKALGVIKHIKATLFDYNFVLDDLDVYNYIEYKTSFHPEKMRLLKSDMEVWAMVVDDETLIDADGTPLVYFKKHDCPEHPTPDDIIKIADILVDNRPFAWDFTYRRAIRLLERMIEEACADYKVPELEEPPYLTPMEIEILDKFLIHQKEVVFVRKEGDRYLWVQPGRKQADRCNWTGLSYLINRVYGYDYVNWTRLERYFNATNLRTKKDSSAGWTKEIDRILKIE